MHPPLIAFQDYSRAISDIAFSHDGTLLASGSQGGILYLWGMDAYQAPVMLHHFDETITSLDFSADDTLLAVALSDYTVRLWDLSEQREMVSLEGHTGLVSSVTFSPDGRLLASGSMYPDETARLWGIP